MYFSATTYRHTGEEPVPMFGMGPGLPHGTISVG
jgi:hypothetical protein